MKSTVSYQYARILSMTHHSYIETEFYPLAVLSSDFKISKDLRNSVQDLKIVGVTLEVYADYASVWKLL